MFSYLIFLLFASALVHAAPHKAKNKKYNGPQLVYDQKQTGEYNVQLHLKDFQIIAMLGDDVLGDYDYNYDYADFTVKPSGSTSTSSKPTSSTSPPSTTHKEKPSTSSEPIIVSSDPSISDSKDPSSSQKPSSIVISNAHPYPLEVVVPQPTKKPESEGQNVTKKEVLLDGLAADNLSIPAQDDKGSQDLTLETILNLKPSQKPSSLSTKPTSISPSLPEQLSPSADSNPGKIKVQILGTASKGLSTSSAGVASPEDALEKASGSVLQSELASYKKCSNGYSRDKKGRCRRVRRPGISSQLPFGFGRLASNLATRLRLPTHANPAATSVSTGQ